VRDSGKSARVVCSEIVRSWRSAGKVVVEGYCGVIVMLEEGGVREEESERIVGVFAAVSGGVVIRSERFGRSGTTWRWVLDRVVTGWWEGASLAREGEV